ncbi:MAG TPA: hypothetical protein VFI25_15815 [Planctomycetota bacterium]|jgi:hypothetical protein|nr:hypothetical protein [Planctomycetota bacterium]
MRRRSVRALLVAGTLFLLALTLLSRFVQWGAPPYPLEGTAAPPVGVMTYEEYGRIEHGRPYVLDLGGGGGALLYFGIGHTNDPGDPQIARMRERWRAFRPTVALCEGRLPLFVGTRSAAIRRFGEAAEVYALASESAVAIHSLESPREEEAAHLLERFPAAKVALFFTLRTYASYRRGSGTEGAEGFAQGALRRVRRLPGLETSLVDLEALGALYGREFPDRPDWRAVPDSFFDPGKTDTWMNEVQTRSNRFRDARMVALLLHLVRRGERVFAAVGASHVVMAEPALRAALGG